MLRTSNGKHLVGVVRRIGFFFCGFHKELRRDTRGSQKQWQVGPWPCFLQLQIVTREDNVASKESLKLTKIRKRGYVRVEGVKSFNSFLYVPKVEDIRILYNGTYISLNTSLWYPHLLLHTFGYTLHTVDKGSFLVDQDIGEMFLNLVLSD